jgi:hypothetical protein
LREKLNFSGHTGVFLDMVGGLVQNARPPKNFWPGTRRRAGRAVECTSLENWQGLTPFVSSNLTPSTTDPDYFDD